VQLFIFFNCPLKNQLISIEKIMCCKCVRYKKYDKKNGGQHHKGSRSVGFSSGCTALSRACALEGGFLFHPKQIKDLFFTASLRQAQDKLFFFCYFMG
jgi:hypothetical protein